jgi:hypothetical protein
MIDDVHDSGPIGMIGTGCHDGAQLISIPRYGRLVRDAPRAPVRIA